MVKAHMHAGNSGNWHWHWQLATGKLATAHLQPFGHYCGAKVQSVFMPAIITLDPEAPKGQLMFVMTLNCVDVARRSHSNLLHVTCNTDAVACPQFALEF